MLHGFEDKMSVFKKHKPFLRALQDQGMVEDTSKFDLAMNIAGGDKEAFKQHAKNQGWDLMEMDMDEVSYDSKPQAASKMEMALDDVIETANRSGVQNRMESLLSKDWDTDSVMKLLNSPEDGNVLVNHMQSGIYDAVQERISEKSRTDVSGSFGNRNNYERYMIASQELESEYQTHMQRESTKVDASAKDVVDKKAVADEAARIEKERGDVAYKKAADKREEEANTARNKAIKVSGSKSKPKKAKKEVDKMKLTGDGFNDYFNKEILGIK